MPWSFNAHVGHEHPQDRCEALTRRMLRAAGKKRAPPKPLQHKPQSKRWARLQHVPRTVEMGEVHC